MNSWPSGVKVNQPPILDIEKYSMWKREFTSQEELYGFLLGSYLLSVIGPGPTSAVENTVMGLFRETKSKPEARTVANLIESRQIICLKWPGT